MFDFDQWHKWKRPEGDPPPRPILMVDGEVISAKGAGVVSGSFARVIGVNDKNFGPVVRRLNVEALSVYDARISDLSALHALADLKHLKVEWASKLTSLEPLRGLTQLETLHLSDLKNISDLAPVAALLLIDDFAFEGGVWDSATAITLEPISRMERLQKLRLANLRVLDGSLRPIAKCKLLKDLWVSNQFKMEEYAYLAAVRPDIVCDRFQPWTPFNEDRVLLTGKGTTSLHRIADRDKLVAHESKFNALKKTADGASAHRPD
jgi:hypothetical protein